MSVETLTDESLAAMEADPVGYGADTPIVRRLLATIRAREAERADLLVAAERLVTAWRAEAGRYEALIGDLGDAAQQHRYRGRANQCKQCAFDLAQSLLAREAGR